MKILNIDDLLKSNSKKIDLIRYSTDGNFDRDIYPVILKIASWFNSLPLNSVFFDEPGGAFRCCIESAYFVMRQAKATIFTSDLTSDVRRELEPQYQFAAFLAGIVSWVDEPFRHYDLTVGERDFNPTVHGDFTQFLNNDSIFEIKNKPTPLSESRQRTILLSSAMILPLMEKMAPKVQDALIGAINPERRPQNSESVIQRVVRKGLSQAEESERKSKQLFAKPVDRDVSTANMIKQIADENHDSSLGLSQTIANNDKKATDGVPSESKQTLQDKFEEKQSRLALDSTTLPKMPKQYQELLAALAQDIRSKKLSSDLASWTQTGLLIPKKFFSNYGKAINQVIEDLRKAEVITGNTSTHVVICPSVGEMLHPRKD